MIVVFVVTDGSYLPGQRAPSIRTKAILVYASLGEAPNAGQAKKTSGLIRTLVKRRSHILLTYYKVTI